MPEETDRLWKDEVISHVLEQVPIGFMLVTQLHERDNHKSVWVREVNNEFLRIFNLTRKECAGHTLQEVFPKRAPSWISLVEKSRSTGRPVKAERYIKDI